MNSRLYAETVFNQAAEKSNVPHRSTLGTAQEAEAALKPTLVKLELEVRRAFLKANLNFDEAWDTLLVRHLQYKGWKVTGTGSGRKISG